MVLNKNDLAEYLKVSTRTIDRMIEYGIPYYKTSADNGLLRFDVEEVRKWMRENTQKK